MSNWLILGAAGGIASALGRELAARGHALILADQKSMQERLEWNAADLKTRYRATVHTLQFDALDFDKHDELLNKAEELAGPLEGVLLTTGVMWDQEELQNDPDRARLHHDINYTSAMSLLGLVANRFEQRGGGQIVAIGSPAGDRGRQSNYLYGADKAALHVFMQGLRQRLAPAKVNVLTIKPGPTRTPMTEGMEKLPLPSMPERVAADIARAIDKRCDVVYVPWFWQWIMHVIRHIPEVIFKRLKM
ncbi:SDR family oxidoreductase [bacterium]|nr:SDR family oxidoreductase [bacterium]